MERGFTGLMSIKKQPDISILLPTRGRTKLLQESLNSLIDLADCAEGLEFLLAFDDDDPTSAEFFTNSIAPALIKKGCQYFVFQFPRMGYAHLNRYLNFLGKHARADWWVFWNDDAVMLDSGWDTEICSRGDQFCIQAFDTHKSHPYSIFPIVPRAWFDILGHLSQHALNDAYISQIAWLLDIMIRIPVKVEHRRFDLTGSNKDKTYEERCPWQLEGNVNNIWDFNHMDQRRLRIADANKLAVYLGQQGHDMTHWNEAVSGKRDPWAKMLSADINHQMKVIP